MVALYLLLCVLGIVWSILCIILFFKIWRMTNDVSIIKDLLKRHYGDNIDYDVTNNGSSSTKLFLMSVGVILLTILILVTAYALTFGVAQNIEI